MEKQDEQLHNPTCFNNYMSEYVIEAQYMISCVNALKLGQLKTRRELNPQAGSNHYPDGGARVKFMSVITPDQIAGDQKNRAFYTVINGGVAVIELCGAMMKGYSKFEDTCSTLITRKALRLAASDPSVNSILMIIDSPGGTVAGTEELGNDVSNIDQNFKPVIAQVDDCCASAALWVASQARKVFANATAMVGSIGTIVVLQDLSKAAEMMGIKVHVISTGKFKGTGVPGSEITGDQVDYVQERVNNINEFFLKAVAAGRKMDLKDVRQIADGRMFMSNEAKKLGLIDAVQSMDETITMMGDKFKGSGKNAKYRSQEAELTMKFLEEKNFK